MEGFSFQYLEEGETRSVEGLLIRNIDVKLRTPYSGTMPARNLAYLLGADTITPELYSIDGANYYGYSAHFNSVNSMLSDNFSIFTAYAYYGVYLENDAEGLLPLGVDLSSPIILQGEVIPRVYTDDFMYIRTSGASGAWHVNGFTAKTDILAVVPRSIGYGNIASFDGMYF